MIKILFKAFILVCIILSIYFIVNPSACSNLINGRVVNSMDTIPEPQVPPHNAGELFVPSGDKMTKPEAKPAEQAQNEQQASEEAPTAGYTQADIDYAIANRYVELENEYAKQNKDTQAAAKDISYVVMDDFEMTPSEWEAFLQRATASNLFEKVRQEYAEKEEQAKQAPAVTDTNSSQTPDDNITLK